MAAKHDHLFKLLLIGDAEVGKSCSFSRFTDNRFSDAYDPTIGIDYGGKIVDIDTKTIKLQIWDTAGQESFRSITRSYYRGAHGIIIVYDVTKPESFDNVNNWMKEIKNSAPENVQIMLIGNKCDLEDKRAVTAEEGKTFAEKHKLLFLETSAKTANNIQDSFLNIASKIYFDVVPKSDGESKKQEQKTERIEQRTKGYLLKDGDKVWMVIEGNYLCLYKQKQDIHLDALQKYDLAVYDQIMAVNNDENKYEFKLFTSKSKQTSFHQIFTASSNDEMMGWIQGISEAQTASFVTKQKGDDIDDLKEKEEVEIKWQSNKSRIKNVNSKSENCQQEYMKLYDELKQEIQAMKKQNEEDKRMNKSLTLIDLEDFLPLLLLDEKQYGIDDDSKFVENQYKKFLMVTADDIAIEWREFRKLQKFQQIILNENEPYEKNKNKLRRNFLFNLIYHKYQFDIQSIESENVFINFYFQPDGNSAIKQFFVASVQILFTVLLLMEIIVTFEDIDFENKLNISGAVIIMYLVVVLIKSSISSIINDLSILNKYFHVDSLNTVLNITSNIIIATLMPFVTFFVILSSESITDIVLNATAIAFIIDLDDDAANAVDLENWFVTATLIYQDIFKEIVPRNDVPTEDEVGDKVFAILNKLKNHNTITEYDDIEIFTKLCHFTKDLAEFLTSPILILWYPIQIISAFFQYLWGKKCCKESHEAPSSSDRYIEAPIKHEPRMNVYKSVASEEHKNDDIDENITTEMIENKEYDVLSNDEENHETIIKVLALNDKGNDCIHKYAFNDAYGHYKDAIDEYNRSLLQKNKKNVEIESILYYNKGYALYKRAKQSFISETITNRNGLVYINYKKAEQSFNKSKEKLILSTGISSQEFDQLNKQRIKQLFSDQQLRRLSSIELMISNIYYDLYEFDKAKGFFKKYNDNNINGNVNRRRFDEIEKKEKMWSKRKVNYLEILENFRKCIYENAKKEYDVDKLIIIANDDQNELFRNDKMLRGKYCFVISEYYAKIINEMESKWTKEAEDEINEWKKEKEKGDVKEDEPPLYEADESEQKAMQQYCDEERTWAIQANNASSVYGLRLLNVAKLDNEIDLNIVCNDIITEYGNQIEYDPSESYYYYCRGVAHRKLSELQIQRNKVHLNNAVNDFEEAIKLNETNPLFWFSLAECQSDLGDMVASAISVKAGFDSIVNKDEKLTMQCKALQLECEQFNKIVDHYKSNLDKYKMDNVTHSKLLQNIIDQVIREIESLGSYQQDVYKVIVKQIIKQQTTSKYQIYKDPTYSNKQQYKLEKAVEELTNICCLLWQTILRYVENLMTFQTLGLRLIASSEQRNGYTEAEWMILMQSIPSFIKVVDNYKEIVDFERYANDGVVTEDGFKQFLSEFENLKRVNMW